MWFGVGEDSSYQPDKHSSIGLHSRSNMAAQLASRNIVSLPRRSERRLINGI